MNLKFSPLSSIFFSESPNTSFSSVSSFKRRERVSAKVENQENKTMKKSKSESQQTQTRILMDELPHSPLRTHSPLRSDQPIPIESSPEKSQEKSQSKAIVAFDKYSTYSPHQSTLPEHPKPSPTPPENTNSTAVKFPSPVVVLNRSVREDLSAAVTKVGPGGGGGENGGGERRSGRAVMSILRRSKREEMVNRASLGFRVCEVVLCLVSFSVMAADKTQGWSGDSFDRYKEYRYCLSVTVIAFVYSGFQAYDLAYHLITEKHLIQHHLRCHFELFMDQILAYLLISAASAAATRVDDWQSNWGKDEFTVMASASVAMAFLAFVAFAFSSLISGYNFFSCNSA